MKLKQHVTALMVLLCVLLLFCSCDKDTPKKEPYVRPPIRQVSYDTASFQMSGDFGVFLDKASDGYVCALGKSQQRLKFNVILNDEDYTYDLKNDGTVEVFPLQMGSGTYVFEIWENIEGTRYSQVLTTEQAVTITDEFAPFLIPSQIVNYAEDSQVVALTNEVTKNASTEAEVVDAIYEYVTDNIAYDTDLAERIVTKNITSYVPDLDTVITKQAGICYDYSSLFAAMLRSQGIPTKLITGNVAPDDIPHAWNMVYLKDAGWVYKEIKIARKAWGRIDTTFAAGKNDTSLSNLVGDGTTYIEKKTF